MNISYPILRFNEHALALPQIPEACKFRIATLKELCKTRAADNAIKNALYFFSTIYLYSSVAVPLAKRTILVMGEVLDDGVGDYHHILNAAEWIKSKFPHIKVTMLVSHEDDRLPSMVRKPSDLTIGTYFIKSGDFPDHLYPLVTATDFLIEMSQPIEGDQLNAAICKKRNKYRFIGEYGFDSFQSMGIRPYDLGIIIKDALRTSSLLYLENPELKQVLFGTQYPDKEDLEDYCSTHKCFFGYLKMGSYYQMGFIYTIAAYLKSFEGQLIDLIIPPVKMEYLDIEFLKNQGIGEIDTVTIQNEQIAYKKTALGIQGKTLRLIHPFPLKQTDLHTLLAYTSPLVGCTGDHTLSEVFSFNRVPFYELRYAKKGFFEQLIKLAKIVGQPPYYLEQYFVELLSIYDEGQEFVIMSLNSDDKVDDGEQILEHFKAKQPQIAQSALKIAHLLQHLELFSEAVNLNVFLKTYYSFNPLLQNIVERNLVLASYPCLFNAETEIRKRFLEDSITLDQATECLCKEIQKATSKD